MTNQFPWASDVYEPAPIIHTHTYPTRTFLYLCLTGVIGVVVLGVSYAVR